MAYEFFNNCIWKHAPRNITMVIMEIVLRASGIVCKLLIIMSLSSKPSLMESEISPVVMAMGGIISLFEYKVNDKISNIQPYLAYVPFRLHGKILL